VALGVVVVVAAGLVLGVRYMWDELSRNSSTGCNYAAGTDPAAYHTDTEQSSVAAQMVAVVISRRLPERAAVLVIAAALQESKLANLSGGDRDSVGVLQQRPSQGWGTPAELTNVTFATGAFLDALVKDSHWQTETLATAIQTVQISADASAYAPHEGQAQAMADALMGTSTRSIVCSFAKATEVAAPSAIAKKLTAQLPVNTPTISGPTITVPGASWATAAWLVSNADALGISTVQCRGYRWERSKKWIADVKAIGVAATLATT
jgi:hypothetical protein